MSAMIDEVAKHIYRAHRIGAAFDITTGKPIPDEEDTLWMLYRPMAKSAIEALRDPTEAMVDEAVLVDEEMSVQAPQKAVKMIWWAMIDEALK